MMRFQALSCFSERFDPGDPHDLDMWIDPSPDCNKLYSAYLGKTVFGELALRKI